MFMGGVMCGRLNVTDDPLARIVSELVGINFSPQQSVDLRPTNKVSTIAYRHGGYYQHDLCWGFKPEWASRHIINAKAETAAIKPTFRQAFAYHRVVVPCSGWYEWREETSRKQKYLFSNPQGLPLYLAGLAVDGQFLVILTTEPSPQYRPYHSRMPVLLPEASIMFWISAPPHQAQSCLYPGWQPRLSVQAVE
ncbi:SOS response-associated peptidase family protein [Vibrio sp. CAU 1672]|uniref:SOS response-associated peptidase n=1 Tax=Vibrio sp. CAU 1672 TaxID=3032594 RepID=UPI0023DCBF0E|nr:SOS response-associated peptidase family protein [Vibrio sp. CAU 1672]MDF2152547.1 SOS response-associated peptidase family protein [Vibrio sp. CAU 1672]